VPMADCFVVEERLLVESAGNKIAVAGYFRIQFTKDSIFRSVIEKQTSKEFLEYFENYKSFVWTVSIGRPDTWKPTKDGRPIAIDDSDKENDPADAGGVSKKKTKKRKGVRKFLGNQLGRFARALENLANRI